MADPFPGPQRVLEPQNAAEVRGKEHITIVPSMTLEGVMKFMQIPPPARGWWATLSQQDDRDGRERGI